MSSATRSRSFRSVLVTVLCAPLILLERSRGLGRWLLFALYGLLAVVAVAYAVRSRNLAKVPDLGTPFDLAAYCDGGPDDAYPLYQKALEQYQAPSRRTEDGVMNLLSEVQSARYNAGPITADVLAWIDENRPALETWRQATERSGFGYHPREERGIGSEWIEYGIGTNIATGAPLPVRQLDLNRGMLRWMAEWEARRLWKVGDLDRAWTWHRALLQYSRHVGMRSGFSDRLAAAELHREACDLAELWALGYGTDGTQLRRALADVLEIGKRTPSLSDTLKADYLETIRLLNHPTMPVINRVVADLARRDGEVMPAFTPPLREDVRITQGIAPGPEGEPYRAYLPDPRASLLYYLHHEPETSRRLIGQVYANWLAFCDNPPKQRPATVSPFELFDAPPSAPRRMSVPVLVEELSEPSVARNVLSPWSEIEKTLQAEQTRQAQLVVAIASQLYSRERGKEITSPRDLVGSYLKEVPEGYTDPLETPPPPSVRPQR